MKERSFLNDDFVSGTLSLKEVVNHYISYYAAGSSHTARAKRSDLDQFLSFLAYIKGYKSPDKLKLSDWDFSSTREFVEQKLGLGESPATVSRRLATVKHMGRTLAENIPKFINPAREVRPPKLKVLKPKALSDNEIECIGSLSSERLDEKPSFIRLRNKMIFSLLLDTGLRADEVRLLRFSQLDKNLEWIKNVRTKAKHYRNVYITSLVREQLSDYLEAREKELKRFYPRFSKQLNDAHPLFISNYGAVPGKPESFYLGAKTLWRAIRELSVETRLHPHLLRHSYAIDLLNSTNDIRLVAQALGHSDVRVTMRYTERGDEEVAIALEQAREIRKSRSAN